MSVLGGLAAWGVWVQLTDEGPVYAQTRAANTAWPREEGWQTTRASAKPAPAAQAPHVVLVLGCTVRRDFLEPYGGPSGATPWLQGAADEGVRFDDVIATAPWTKASAVGLLAGRHAEGVGMTEPGPERNHRVLPADIPTLGERLANAGWTTVGITANPNLNTAFGLARGFDRYHDAHGAITEENASRGGGQVVEDVLGQLDSWDGQGPLYLQVTLTDTHAPRQATEAEILRFADSQTGPVALYLATLRRLDTTLAHLDTQLAARGLTAENTLFVFVADHGEALHTPPHHGGTHGRTLYPSVVRIPWLMRGPGVSQGHVVQGLVSGVDLLPTVLELVGLPADPALPGHSWAAAVGGQGGRTARTEAWSDTRFHATDRTSLWTRSTQCQLELEPSPRDDGPWPDGCFNRIADKQFLRPVVDPQRMDQIRAWRAEQASLAAQREQPEQATVSEEMAERLRALGYAD